MLGIGRFRFQDQNRWLICTIVLVILFDPIHRCKNVFILDLEPTF
jgi:hypothetical protein